MASGAKLARRWFVRWVAVPEGGATTAREGPGSLVATTVLQTHAAPTNRPQGPLDQPTDWHVYVSTLSGPISREKVGRLRVYQRVAQVGASLPGRRSRKRQRCCVRRTPVTVSHLTRPMAKRVPPCGAKSHECFSTCYDSRKCCCGSPKSSNGCYAPTRNRASNWKPTNDLQKMLKTHMNLELLK